MIVDAEKIVRASLEVQKGCSLKDFLDDYELEEIVHTLADILVLTGTRLSEDDE